MSWKAEFEAVLPLLGHRNWILVVDKAYPLQSAAGMTYLNSGEAIEEVLPYVLDSVEQASHVKPIVYTDLELTYLTQFDEKEQAMVASLQEIFSSREVNTIKHDDIFEKLDKASKLFNVVVIKTESTVAYSSVFIELDCGYWSSEKEQKLRNLMK